MSAAAAPPAAGQVTAWWAAEADIAPATLARLVPAREHAHAAALALPARARSYLAARALLRAALSQWAPAVAPAAWRFGPRAGGRPEVVEPTGTGLRFSLSHAHGLVAVALARHYDVGVDLEPALPRAYEALLWERALDAQERAALARCPAGEARRRHFTACWVLKEAYAKARGTGLRLELRGVGARPGAEGAAALDLAARPEEAGEAWHAALHACGPLHLLGVAVRHTGAPLPRIVMDPAWPAAAA